MSAELEIEIDAYLGARAGAEPLDGLARSARRRHAVERPRDGLEQRRFARAVRADDSRDARVEVDAGVDVLPEVREVKMIEAHQVASTIAAGTNGTALASSR